MNPSRTVTTAAAKHILLVEDDDDIADLLELHLTDEGYRVDVVNDGDEGLDRALECSYDLIVLDIMLPGTDGFDICRRLRQEKCHVPILMVTAKTEEVDKVLGLELGADDYITKPFSIREVLARVKAIFRRVEVDQGAQRPDAAILMVTAKTEEVDKVLGLELGADDYITKPFSIREVMARVKAIFRRVEVNQEEPAQANPDTPIEYDGLVIEPAKRKVTVEGDSVDLTSKEYDLLLLFARNPGRAYSRQELLDEVWGYQYSGYSHTVNTHINRLRNKIEPNPSSPRYVKTVWGVGYRFAEREELEASDAS